MGGEFHEGYVLQRLPHRHDGQLSQHCTHNRYVAYGSSKSLLPCFSRDIMMILPSGGCPIGVMECSLSELLAE